MSGLVVGTKERLPEAQIGSGTGRIGKKGTSEVLVRVRLVKRYL